MKNSSSLSVPAAPRSAPSCTAGLEVRGVKQTDDPSVRAAQESAPSCTARSDVRGVRPADGSLMHGVPSEKLQDEHDAIYEAAKAQSSGRIKAGFILGEIAKNEKIELGAKEVSEQIREDAARYRMSPDKYRSELEEHGAMEGFRENLLAEKVLEFLLEKAEISK